MMGNSQNSQLRRKTRATFAPPAPPTQLVGVSQLRRRCPRHLESIQPSTDGDRDLSAAPSPKFGFLTRFRAARAQVEGKSAPQVTCDGADETIGATGLVSARQVRGERSLKEQLLLNNRQMARGAGS